MTAQTWKKNIKKCCQQAGTYQKCFDNVIDTLASILEKRDAAAVAYEEAGGMPVIEGEGSMRQKVFKKSPALSVWEDLNAQALNYWRDLGLTPAGLRKINESAVKQKKVSALAAALKELE